MTKFEKYYYRKIRQIAEQQYGKDVASALSDETLDKIYGSSSYVLSIVIAWIAKRIINRLPRPKGKGQ